MKTEPSFVSPLVDNADRKYRWGSCEIFQSRCPNKIGTHSDSDEPRPRVDFNEEWRAIVAAVPGYRNSENITKCKKKGKRRDRKGGRERGRGRARGRREKEDDGRVGSMVRKRWTAKMEGGETRGPRATRCLHLVVCMRNTYALPRIEEIYDARGPPPAVYVLCRALHSGEGFPLALCPAWRFLSPSHDL